VFKYDVQSVRLSRRYSYADTINSDRLLLGRDSNMFGVHYLVNGWRY